MDGKHDFLAIVVGAGVAGLVTSHILQKAKIPHVVLEKRSEVAPPQGASIAIYPHGARILYQLGIYEQVKQACEPCKWWYSRDPSGKVITQNGFFGHVRRK
jgi:2-polyprenyl-6-methoxyphenol hydroxylase-like FAD-dependent oxidoreductase